MTKYQWLQSVDWGNVPQWLQVVALVSIAVVTTRWKAAADKKAMISNLREDAKKCIVALRKIQAYNIQTGSNLGPTENTSDGIKQKNEKQKNFFEVSREVIPSIEICSLAFPVDIKNKLLEYSDWFWRYHWGSDCFSGSCYTMLPEEQKNELDKWSKSYQEHLDPKSLIDDIVKFIESQYPT